MTAKKHLCPVCSKPEAADHRPFCSKRCADIDLGRWLTESYAVPTRPSSKDEDQPGSNDE